MPKKPYLQKCSAYHSQQHLAFRFCRVFDAWKKIGKPQKTYFPAFSPAMAFQSAAKNRER